MDDASHYIGDGVYVRFDGIYIWVETLRASGSHVIALEPEVFRSLLDFAKEIGWLK